MEAKKSAGIRSVFGPLASPGLGASFRTRIPTASERGQDMAWVVFSSGFGAVVGLVGRVWRNNFDSSTIDN